MTLEEEIFNKSKIKENLLKKYGFKKKNGKYIYEHILSKNDFKLIVEYDDKINAKILDLSLNEEYTNFRIENFKGFAFEIRQEFIDILEDIKEKCSEKLLFQSNQAREINKFIFEKFQDLPEFLWENLPDYAIYRKKSNQKWYVVIGLVERSKVDKTSKSNKKVEIMNVKVKSDELKNLLKQKGIYEAYHMNKKNWITIILDDELGISEVKKLVFESYNNV